MSSSAAEPIRTSSADAAPTRAVDGEVVIEARGVSKAYRMYRKPIDRLKQAFAWGRRQYFREFWALHDVSFQMKRGQMVGVIGRNGSGKSTLLQIIAGTLTPTEGEITVPSRVAALLELGSGFHIDATGRENVFMNAAILGLSQAEIEQKYDSIAAFADIGDFIDQPVKTYSSGMAVRLAFAVAAHVDARVLIVDEALAVGDAPFQAKCYRRIRKLREDGVTILLATHDTQIVASMCDHALLLDRGRTVMLGSGKTVAEEYYRRVRELERAEAYVAAANNNRPTGATGPADARLEAVEAKAGTRMGDGGAEIVGYEIYDHNNTSSRSLAARQRCRFVMAVRFKRALHNPHAGMALRDVHGKIMFGGHTQFDGGRIGPVNAGEEATVTFEAALNLKPGKYLLFMGVAEHEDFWHWKDCDVLMDLCEVEVYGDLSWGVVSVPITVDVQRKDAS